MKQTGNTKTYKYEITATLLPHNTLAYSCSYIVHSVHEYFAVTNSHLQILQHQASLKHENFTVSYRSYPNLNEVVSVVPNFIWAVVICPNIYNIANLNETLPICSDGANCTQVWTKLFQLPNMIEAVGIFPNVSNCMQISMKHLYITQIGMKLFEVHQKWLKLCEVSQK